MEPGGAARCWKSPAPKLWCRYSHQSDTMWALPEGPRWTVSSSALPSAGVWGDCRHRCQEDQLRVHRWHITDAGLRGHAGYVTWQSGVHKGPHKSPSAIECVMRSPDVCWGVFLCLQVVCLTGRVNPSTEDPLSWPKTSWTSWVCLCFKETRHDLIGAAVWCKHLKQAVKFLRLVWRKNVRNERKHSRFNLISVLMFYRDTCGQNQALSVRLTRSHSNAHLLINTSPQCGTCGYTLTSLRVRAGLDRVDSHAVQVKHRIKSLED